MNMAGLSLTPNFSWVNTRRANGQPFQRFALAGETVETVEIAHGRNNTQLKQGVNERPSAAVASKQGVNETSETILAAHFSR